MAAFKLFYFAAFLAWIFLILRFWLLDSFSGTTSTLGLSGTAGLGSAAFAGGGAMILIYLAVLA
jgi:hypothetical protein